MTVLGAVAIGRNEGERLGKCLESLRDRFSTIVYVDSGSTDGSRDLAAALGAAVLELETSLPFTAARARNAGLARLLELVPETELVQFIDGDCELRIDWTDGALKAIQAASGTDVVCGRRRERFPEASIFHRMIDLEWDTPIGELESCGGDAIFRVSALQRVGGFNDSVVAGEEPELCTRLRKSGSKILRIDVEMTWHDAAIHNLRQWWRRHMRSGYGALDVQQRFGVTLFDHELRSARTWTVGFLGVWVVLVAVLSIFMGWLGLVLGTCVAIVVWSLQTFRLARYFRRNDFAWGDSWHAAWVTMLVKWGNLLGQLRYMRDRRQGKVARTINYKNSSLQAVVEPSEHA